MKPLAKPALEAVQKGEIKIHPAYWTKVYTNWMEDIHDWCISRQIWWGHRIPVWYDKQGHVYVAKSLQEARLQAQERLMKQRLQNEKAASVKSFCERWLREKRVVPSEVDAKATVPNLYHRLMRASVTKVHKFGEGASAKQMTDFDLCVAEIEARPAGFAARMFSEKLKDPADSAGTMSPERRAELLKATPFGSKVLQLGAATAK